MQWKFFWTPDFTAKNTFSVDKQYTLLFQFLANLACFCRSFLLKNFYNLINTIQCPFVHKFFVIHITLFFICKNSQVIIQNTPHFKLYFHSLFTAKPKFLLSGCGRCWTVDAICGLLILVRLDGAVSWRIITCTIKGGFRKIKPCWI